MDNGFGIISYEEIGITAYIYFFFIVMVIILLVASINWNVV